ncbi:hypothetical protein HNY73_006435 [Argiope bruennichi]|uniref:Uncharacterized protein n=1 Tax=Argiope bruennichi TaxID=94029 RepID=A0A8T0FSA9_ARGBR|nr:hypothetical protein HNY73_006435 [Argiope bruennichi]
MEAGKEEQRGEVRFFYCKRNVRREIHARMSAVHGKNSMPRARVFERNKRFRYGQVSLKDSSRPGEAHLVIILYVISAVNAAVRNDCRWTMKDIRLMMSINYGIAHSIFTEHLKYRKICAQWVPHCLTEEQKLKRMST